MLAADGEHGAEVYSGATTREQAWEVFRPALLMAKATPAFFERYGVVPFKQSHRGAGHGLAVRAADRQARRRRLARAARSSTSTTSTTRTTWRRRC